MCTNNLAKASTQDYGLMLKKVPLYCDSIGVINLSKNPIQHSKTEHIKTKNYFIRDHVQKDETKLKFVETEKPIHKT